jgi:hypothetical protein
MDLMLFPQKKNPPAMDGQFEWMEMMALGGLM